MNGLMNQLNFNNNNIEKNNYLGTRKTVSLRYVIEFLTNDKNIYDRYNSTESMKNSLISNSPVALGNISRSGSLHSSLGSPFSESYSSDSLQSLTGKVVKLPMGMNIKFEEHPPWIPQLFGINNRRVAVLTHIKDEEESLKLEGETIEKNISFISCINAFIRPCLIFANKKQQKDAYYKFESHILQYVKRNYRIARNKRERNIGEIIRINNTLCEKIKRGKIDKSVMQIIVDIEEINVIIINIGSEQGNWEILQPTNSTTNVNFNNWDTINNLPRGVIDVIYPFEANYPLFNIYKNLCILFFFENSCLFELALPEKVWTAGIKVLDDRIHNYLHNSHLVVYEMQIRMGIQPKYALAPEHVRALKKKKESMDNFNEDNEDEISNEIDESIDDNHIYQSKEIQTLWRNTYFNLFQLRVLRIKFRLDDWYLEEIIKSKLSLDSKLKIIMNHFNIWY